MLQVAKATKLSNFKSLLSFLQARHPYIALHFLSFFLSIIPMQLPIILYLDSICVRSMILSIE